MRDRFRHLELADVVQAAAHALVLVAAAVLFAWFVLSLQSSGDSGASTADQVSQRPTATEPPAGPIAREAPIIYVSGPPEVVAALRADLSAAIVAAGLEGGPTPELIIAGPDGGQRKIFFIDLANR